ncbi:MAG TPA: ABC transporter permease [Vicinamibacterales bacterium]|nr:ABC transporter permease [Vicinamibacterales bacterium]
MAWQHRLWNLLRQRRLDDEIDEELAFHIASCIHDNIAAGMSADEAQRDALRRFGSRTAMRERTRDADLISVADDLRQDLAFAARSLRRRPGFTLVALLTLGIGIGATAAIFTVVRSVLLRPLPFPDPDALHAVDYAAPVLSWLYPGMSDRGYLAFREANRTFESLATFAAAQCTLTGAGDATRLVGAAVTADFFRVLGVAAAAGRTLQTGDDLAEGEKVVVVSHALWRDRFGADPALVDKTLTLDGLRYRVVGIMPPQFSYPADATYWIPLTVRILPNLGYTRPVIGRVKSGITREQAQADLDLWVRSLPPDPNRQRNLVARVVPLHRAMVGDARLPLVVFGGAVVFLLSIACANVANLLLMRAVSRRQEIATRLALGAGRGRLARQLLTESALLATAGGVAGVALAWLAGPALLALVPAGRLPPDISIGVDAWVLAFTVGLSLITGLVVGLAPIVQLDTTGQYGTLRSHAATRHSHRLRQALVVAQVALTLVLLVGAGLLIRSFAGLRSVPLGFSPDRVMTMTIDLPTSRYATAADTTMFHSRVLQALAEMPGVQSAAAVNWLPLGKMVIFGDVQAEDRPDLIGQYNATKVAISPRYFETMGIRLLRGRAFTDADGAGGPPVLIVSESVARRLWPSGDPIGKRMALRENPKPEEWLTVVGVVEDVRQGGFRTPPTHAVYQPYTQVTNRFFVGYMTFLVRTSDDAAQAAPLMRAALRQVDSNEAPESVAALEAVIDGTVAEPRFQARVLLLFSGVALLLAAVGIYGVMAASVLERRFEIGVRMALGADRTSLIRMVLVRTLILTVAGLALGVAGSFALTGALQRLLFNVTPTDALTFTSAVVILLVAALLASLLPARRASSIDPLVALRVE